MWDPDTKRVHLTRDIVWLNKMFFNNNLNFINVPGRSNKNSRNTSTNNKAESDPENESDLNNDFQIDNNNDREDIINNNITENIKTTRSGRVIKKPERFREELKNLLIEEEEENYDDNKLLEILCVDDGIGKGILHTNELHVLKYKEAMRGTDQEYWTNAINEEHERMIENKVWKPIKRNDLPADVKLLSTTLAMKKKANGKYRARITARGFLQEDGVHYFSHSTAAPGANELTIKIALTFFNHLT
jgi:hypothetical protein